MFIKYNQYAPNPELRGTIADPKPHIAERLVAQGIAEFYRYPTLKEHLEAIERFRAAATPAPKPTVSWAINPSHSNDPNAPRFIVAESGPNGTLFYNAPPKHAPAHVKQRFDRMIAQDHTDWSERQEFLKRQAAESSTSGYNQTDVAKVLVIGANGVKR